MGLLKWMFCRDARRAGRDALWLVYFGIWRSITVSLMVFGGITLVIAALVGGLCFGVAASTVFVWFAIALGGILVFTLFLGVIFFIVWFLHENIWLLPLFLVLILVVVILCFRGQSYIIDCPTCGEEVCFDDPSEIGTTLCCPGKCSDCKTIISQYGQQKHEKECGKLIDVACQGCGAKNSFEKEATPEVEKENNELSHLKCTECGLRCSAVDITDETGFNLAKRFNIRKVLSFIDFKLGK